MNLGMHQTLSVSMQQRQQLVMTPAMVQAIRLLQLNSMELEQEVIQEMEENPFLEQMEEEEEATGSAEETREDNREDNGAEDGAADDGDERVPDRVEVQIEGQVGTPETPDEDDRETPDLLEKPDHSEDNDPQIEDFYEETYDDSRYATAEAPTEDRDFLQMDSAGSTLYEHLTRQLRVTDLEGKDVEIAEFLIGNIDESGYLRNFTAEGEPAADEPAEADDGELSAEDNGRAEEEDILDVAAQRFEVPRKRVESVLEVIQTFEPVGVGARSIQESLLIQVRAMDEPDDGLITLIGDHFDDLAHRRHKAIARAMKIPERRVAELCQRVATLEPKPGRAITTDTPQYILPDVVVSKIDGKFYIALNEGRTSHLKVSSYYRSKFAHMLSAKRSKQEDEKGTGDIEFIRKKFNDAQTLIRNIERRKGTILKIAQAIMEKQSEFLAKGVEHLRPMTLKDIAAEVGMHEATVSRVTANKWVETPRGTFRLKYFFSSGLESDSGENQSSRAIKSKIQKMIEAEDPKRPLSDQKIADELKRDGLKIARRTVTKYREQMKILPTNMRRQSG